MSKMSEDARSAAKSKAERLVRVDPSQRIDASGYKPDEALNGDVQTGEKPVSRRQYRHGGKVAGEAAAPRADRKPRASGGRTLTADSLINRDVKEANRERGGITHDGGMKKGGRIGKTMGGLALPDWADSVSRKAGGAVHGPSCACAKCAGGRVERKAGGKVGDFVGGGPKGKRGFPMNDAKHQRAAIPGATRSFNAGNISKSKEESIKSEARGKLARARGGPAINDGTRPVGGRLARKGGGRAKKGTNVNIIITQPPAGGAPRPPMPPPGARQPGAAPPVGMGQGMPPGGTLPMPPPGATGVPPAAPLMPRASGGRTTAGFSGKLAKPGAYPIESGAGGGLGRLEKAERAARG
jgi:hypothetical protein